MAGMRPTIAANRFCGQLDLTVYVFSMSVKTLKTVVQRMDALPSTIGCSSIQHNCDYLAADRVNICMNTLKRYQQFVDGFPIA